MSRYIADYTINKPDDLIKFIAEDFLTKEGFRQTVYKGETVWKMCIRDRANLRLKVVGVDIEGQADFLDLDDTLVLSCFLLALRLFKTVLSVVDNFANRRRRLRRNFYKVQILSERHLQRLRGGHNPKLVAVRTDDTHFSVTNFFVDL